MLVLSEAEHHSWVITAPPKPQPWGTHHTKLFLVHYGTGVRVIVHTANLIYGDCNNKTQGIWWQDFPPKVFTPDGQPRILVLVRGTRP